MSPFEYVIVLISIILGLGITTILTGLAEIIKHSGLLRIYVPYLICIVLVFVLHVHEWWVSYGLKTVEVWKLPMFLFILLYPINLYVLAHLLFPSATSTSSTKEFYLDNYPKVFISAMILPALSIVHNFIFYDFEFVNLVPSLILITTLLAVLISKTRNHVVHLIVMSVLLLTMLTTLFLTRDTLLISQ